MVVAVPQTVYLDVSLIKCPYCGKLYVDASWYIIDMESDIDCTFCGRSFNTRKNALDRVLVKFIVDGRIHNVLLDKRLKIEE